MGACRIGNPENQRNLCPCHRLLARWRRVVIDDYNRLWLLAGEDKGDNPPDKRNAKKDVENDDSKRVWAFSLYGHDCGKKIKRQHAKQRDDQDDHLAKRKVL